MRVDIEPSSQWHAPMEFDRFKLESHNAELRDEEGGFLGDRVSESAFLKIIRDRYQEFRKVDVRLPPVDEVTTQDIDDVVGSGDKRQQELLFKVVDQFAQRLSYILKRHLALEAWKNCESIIIGGGFEHTGVGKLVISRSQALLKLQNIPVQLRLLRHDPDKAALLGCMHLAPKELRVSANAFLACDLGGTNFRCGLVALPATFEGSTDTHVLEMTKWRHRDEDVERTDAVRRLADMMCGLIAQAEKRQVRLAPFIGIGCPGVVQHNGHLSRGGHNLPGNWHEASFSLEDELRRQLPQLGRQTFSVRIHNDAVAQGLSEAPFMSDFARWAIVTIGTGFGDACFSMRR